MSAQETGSQRSRRESQTPKRPPLEPTEDEFAFAEEVLSEIAGIDTRRRNGFARQMGSLSPTQIGRRQPEAVENGPGLASSPTGAKENYWDPQLLGKVMSDFVEKAKWEAQIEATSIVQVWPQIVGEQVAKHCRVYVRGERELEVVTDSTAWAQQLRILLPQIEKNIVEIAGKEAISKIIVHGPKAPSWKHGRFSAKGRGPRDTYG